MPRSKITATLEVLIAILGIVVPFIPLRTAHAQSMECYTSFSLLPLHNSTLYGIVPGAVITVGASSGIVKMTTTNPFNFGFPLGEGDNHWNTPPEDPTRITVAGFQYLTINPLDLNAVSITICNPIPATPTPTSTPTSQPTGTPIPTAPGGCRAVIINSVMSIEVPFTTPADVYSWNGTALWESYGPQVGGWVALGDYPTGPPTRIQAGYLERFKARDASNNVQQMLVCDAVGGTPTPTAVPSTSCDPVGAWTPVADRGSGCSPAGPHEPASA